MSINLSFKETEPEVYNIRGHVNNLSCDIEIDLMIRSGKTS